MPLLNDPARLLLCVAVGEYCVSLETRKVYQSLPDAKAEIRGLVRVVDESGEDYRYPSNLFVPVILLSAAFEALKQFEAA